MRVHVNPAAPGTRWVHGVRSGGLLVGLSVLILISSCVTAPTVSTPDGFAAFSEADESLALSPEGVGFRVRTVPNDPEQTLEFWSEALGRHQRESGYLLYDEREFESAAGPGRAFEWLAPVNDDDWIYLTAVVVSGDQIVIAEAAGPVDLYLRHRPAITTALETIGYPE